MTLSVQQIITAIFGAGWTFVRGFDPSPGGHHGWDIANKLGTPIPNLVSGTVVFAGFAGGGGPGYVHPYSPPRNVEEAAAATQFLATGGGNVVVVKDASGTFYQYAHMNTIAVRVGDQVSFGSLLGSVGDTGNATGPHLHFAMFSSTKQWPDPTALLTSLATKGATTWLAAWNGIVSFPVGHILTTTDVNSIIAALDAQHVFQAVGAFPGIGQLAENAARDKVRAILMSHVGQAWNTTLQQTLQTELFGAAAAAVDNPLQGIANIAGRLLDPNTYIHTGAFIVGAIIAWYGLKTVIGSNSSVQSTA